MERKTIAILFGGSSAEHEISLQSAAAVAGALDPARWQPVLVGITRQGEWLRYRGPVPAIADGSWRQGDCVPAMISPDRQLHGLVELPRGGAAAVTPLDLAFPVLHGTDGEDGAVQGLLQLAGVPCVGCPLTASALGMDKALAHQLAALAGVKTPRTALVDRRTPAAELQRLARGLGYPLFVKPVSQGSSFGVSRVPGPDGLAPAVEQALQYDCRVLLEEAVPGFEVGCAVLGNETLTVGGPDEIELAGGFFDFTEKYTLRSSRIHLPARIPQEKAQQIRGAAVKVYRALGCRGFARVDLFLTPAGEIVFNEVNTIPGFTEHSRFPGMMKQAGLSFAQVVERAALLALGFKEDAENETEL